MVCGMKTSSKNWVVTVEYEKSSAIVYAVQRTLQAFRSILFNSSFYDLTLEGSEHDHAKLNYLGISRIHSQLEDTCL